jgi:hypothetical protein
VDDALTDTLETVAVGTTTVIVGDVPLCPSYVPVIVTVPAATAVTVPDDDTVATPVLVDAQLGVTVDVVPSLYVAVALTVVVAPPISDVDDALTVTLDTVTVSTGAFTVMVGDVPLCPSYVPVIVTVPAATAVTVPDDDTVATPVLLDDQLAVTVAVVPSLYVAVALTVVVSSTSKLVSDTLTDRLDTVGAGAAGALTVIVGDVPLWPSYVPVIVTVPAATPVTVPDDDTVATPVLLDTQLGVTVAAVPSLYVAVALTVVVAPTVNDVDDAPTDTLDTVAVGAMTVISTVPLRPSYDAITETVPAATAVTVPDCVTVAMAGSLEPQRGFIAAVVPSL